MDDVSVDTPDALYEVYNLQGVRIGIGMREAEVTADTLPHVRIHPRIAAGSQEAENLSSGLITKATVSHKTTSPSGDRKAAHLRGVLFILTDV